MLIHLYGEDSYRKRLKLDEIIAEFRKKHPAVDLGRFDFEEKQIFQKLKEFLDTPSLFQEAKLALIFNPEDEIKEKGIKVISEILKKFLSERGLTGILVSESRLSKFPWLYKSPAASQEFKALANHELYGFIKSEAEKREIKMTPVALQGLAETCGADTWRIATELDKLALGADFESQRAAPQFFGLIQTIKGRSRAAEKIAALNYLLETEDPAKIFNITAAAAGAELKIRMADCDAAVKSGKLEYPEALLNLVIVSE